MTPRRPGDLIPLTPMPPDERLVLRLHRRTNHPDAHVATDVMAWWWMTPLVVEGPAPLPLRRFDHVAKILAQPSLGETKATRRN